MISFHDHKQDIFKPVRKRVQTAGSRLRTFGVDYLVYALIDLVVDRKFPLIEVLSSHIGGSRTRRSAIRPRTR